MCCSCQALVLWLTHRQTLLKDRVSAAIPGPQAAMVRKMPMGIGGMEEKLLCPQALGTPAVLDPNAMRYNGTYSVHAVGLIGTLFNAF